MDFGTGIGWVQIELEGMFWPAGLEDSGWLWG